MATGPTLEDLSRALAAIHEAACDPERWPQSLVAITEMFQANKGAILDIDPGARGLVGVASIGHDPAAQREYEAHYYGIDPTWDLSLRQAPHKALTVYEEFPASVRARSEYFNFARRVDIGDVIGLSTYGSNGVRSLLSLQRPIKAAAFDADVKRLFALLAPHLETAKRVQARLAEATAVQHSLAAGLDRLVHAAFIVDASAAIQHMNAAAAALLARDPRLRGARGRLALAQPRLNAAFESVVRGAAVKGGRSRLLALVQAGASPAGEISVAPLHESHSLSGAWQRPLALVMVSFPRRDAGAIAARMRQLYGLTAAEARVTALLALGDGIEAIARTNDVAESTLRSQLRSIRLKTGTRRQAELVRLALGGAPLVPDAD